MKNCSVPTAATLFSPICSLISGILLVILMTSLAGCSYNTPTVINAKDYVQVRFYGEDGEGRASASADITRLDDDYGYVHVNNNNDDTVGSEIASGMDFTVTPSDFLSNGDTVTVTITIDDEWVKKNLDCTILGGTIACKVEGLEE